MQFSPKYNHQNSYPFGMLMPGRTYASKAYSWGFNGKEKDDEVSGGGIWQDYGARIYSAILGKFLSPDPLIVKNHMYPELSPFQFASNRPIYGIDLDGLEYVTVKVLIDNGKAQRLEVIDHTSTMSDADIQKSHGMSAEDFYKLHSKSFEKAHGQSIYYEYYKLDPKGNKVLIGGYEEMKESIKTYGLYAGPGCITECGGNDEGNPYMNGIPVKYDFELAPIDEWDAIAKKHDISQSEIPVFQGHWNDPRTLEGDLTLIREVEDYLKRAKSDDYIDKYTKRKPSKDALKNAKQAWIYFENVEIPRKESLNEE